jgi:hypothetical protein
VVIATIGDEVVVVKKEKGGGGRGREREKKGKDSRALDRKRGR